MFLAIVPSCKKSDDSGNNVSVKISPSSLSLAFYQTAKLTYVTDLAEESISSVVWSSADPTVATVSQDGEVTAVALIPASTTVKITLNGNISDSIRVDVVDKGSFTPEEAISYIDFVGQQALSQVVPDDFRNLAYIYEDALTAFIGKGTFVKLTKKDTLQWVNQMEKFYRRHNATTGRNFCFDGNLCGKAKLVLKEDGGTLSYDYENYSTTPFTFDVDSKVKYSGGLKITCDSKDSIFMRSRLDIEPTVIDSFFTNLPKKVEASILFDGKEYAGIEFNEMDFSKMAGIDLTQLDPLSVLDTLNFKIKNGDMRVNGAKSYKIHINEFSMAKSKIVDNYALFGCDGDSLMTFSGKSHFDWESAILIPALVSDGWDMDIMNGYMKINRAADGKIDIYLAGYDKPQLTVDASGEKVTFADGTVMAYEEVFTASNFSQTVCAAIDLIVEFLKIFR